MMGEVFNGVKLGTCEHLMYVRYDEIIKGARTTYGTNKSIGNLERLEDYADPKGRWIYRFPKPKEDGQSWTMAVYRNPYDYIKFTVPDDFEMPHKNIIQINIKEYVFNLNGCPLSLGLSPINNHGKIPVNIVGERIVKDAELYTIFSCGLCDKWFSCPEEEIEIFRKELISQGMPEVANRIKTRLNES
jgi:hypothetical protein